MRRVACVLPVLLLAACSRSTPVVAGAGEPPPTVSTPAPAEVAVAPTVSPPASAEVAAAPRATPAVPSDVPAAEAAIRHAFDTWANPGVTEADRADASEIRTDPAEIAEAKERARKHLAQGVGVTFVVDTITFTSATSADVDFRVRFGDDPSPVVPGIVPGSALWQEGMWRVTHATGCFLAAMINDPCRPSEFLSDEQQAIGQPFADLSRADLSDDERVAQIEQGEQIRDFILAQAHRFAYALGPPLTVLAVRHRAGESRAEVWYTQGSVQPGIAVFDGDHWAVSRPTWCQLTANFGGEACPPSSS